MFDNLITRITSPSSRRRHTYHCPEVHSDPEDNVEPITATTIISSSVGATTPRKPRLLERRKKGRRQASDASGLRQARSLGRLDGLKEAERLADYGRLLGGSQPALVVDGRRRDLDRIQDLFPHDYLGLHVAEPNSTNHVKKSFRKKSLGDISSSTAESNNNGPCNRIFLMEAPCAMSPPHLSLNAKPRHLFLFSDLLLVAKPRSGGSFKLKESVRVSELWLSPCPESPETGFLLGWPSPARTYLVQFCTQAARDSWWCELRRALELQLRSEPPTTNIKVVYRDPLSGTECSKTLGVGPEMSSGDVARLALDERMSDWPYTLYARDRDNAPCPLMGCERPHSIQLARLRQSLCAEEGFDLQHCNNNNRIPSDIVFELKPTIKPTPRRTPLKLFRKSSSGRIFGVPLHRLCTNNVLPPAIYTCLKSLFQRGPHTQGIFRRCASARALRELREKVDSQAGALVCEEISNNTPALLLAALLKDFLRSLPEPLLAGDPQEWLNVPTTASGRLDHLRRLINGLPRENHLLLVHVICVLYSIARRARFNLMSAANLGVCVGPSMLWESTQNAPLRTLPALIEMLINNCQTLFGNQVVSLFGEALSTNNDSGAEESDSLHSLGLSLDSAELSKDQKSLSRDSGLTLSEDDRESPGLNNNNNNNNPSNANNNSNNHNNNTNNHNNNYAQNPSFHRSDWSRQAARLRGLPIILDHSNLHNNNHHNNLHQHMTNLNNSLNHSLVGNNNSSNGVGLRNNGHQMSSSAAANSSSSAAAVGVLDASSNLVMQCVVRGELADISERTTVAARNSAISCWIDEQQHQQQEEAFMVRTSNESLCHNNNLNSSSAPPLIPPRRPPAPLRMLRHLPPVHLPPPPLYRPPPPPPPPGLSLSTSSSLQSVGTGSSTNNDEIYASATKIMLVTDSESESYV